MAIPSPSQLGLTIPSWRPTQEHGIDVIITSKKRAVTIAAPTGSGKTHLVVAAAIMSGKPTCIVTDSRGLQDQYLKLAEGAGIVDIRGRRNYACDLQPDYTCEEGYAARCPYKGTVGCPASQAEMKAASSSLVVTNYAKWTSSHKYGQGMEHFKQVVFDEADCFVAGTDVGGIPIEQRQVGDQIVTPVVSASGVVLRYDWDTVIGTIVKRPTRLYKLNFADGSSLIATPNHPFLTNRGWLPVQDLALASILGDVLCMKHGTSARKLCDLWEAHNHYQLQESLGISEERSNSLQLGLCSETGCETSYVRGAQENAQRENAIFTQSDERPYQSGKDEDKSDSRGPQTDTAIRKRDRTNSTPTITGDCAGVGYGSGRRVAGQTTRLAEELQARCGEQDVESRNRGGWSGSQDSTGQKSGSKEGTNTHFVRLDSFEVYESTNRERFAEVCPTGLVYNLETEKTHTYIASGFLVHNCCPDAVAASMQVILHHREIEEDLGIEFPTVDIEEFVNWKPWVRLAKIRAESEMQAAYIRILQPSPKPTWVRHYTHMKNLVKRLSTLVCANGREWVVEEIEQGYQFDPIRLAKYAEASLFFKIPKIIMVSATVRPKTMFMLGLGKDQFDFHEFDSDFDPKRCPIYYIPTMRVDARNPDNSMLWLKLDQIAAKRRQHRGIVQTVSYARQREVLEASRFWESMIINEKGEAPTEVMESFRKSKPGTILVSPSFGRGYDFPDDACRWQFLTKIPFEPPSKILKAREHVDREYRSYRAMQAMVQIFGRGMRSKTDWCENFIGDEHLAWFLPQNGHLAPKSFHAIFRPVNVVPPPLEFVV